MNTTMCAECGEWVAANLTRVHQRGHRMHDLFACSACGEVYMAVVADIHADKCQLIQILAQQGINELTTWMRT